MNSCTYSLIPYFLALKGIVKKYGSLSDNIVKMTQTLKTKMAHCDDASCFLFYVQRTFLKYRFSYTDVKIYSLVINRAPLFGEKIYTVCKKEEN